MDSNYFATHSRSLSAIDFYARHQSINSHSFDWIVNMFNAFGALKIYRLIAENINRPCLLSTINFIDIFSRDIPWIRSKFLQYFSYLIILCDHRIQFSWIYFNKITLGSTGHNKFAPCNITYLKKCENRRKKHSICLISCYFVSFHFGWLLSVFKSFLARHSTILECKQHFTCDTIHNKPRDEEQRRKTDDRGFASGNADIDSRDFQWHLPNLYANPCWWLVRFSSHRWIWKTIPTGLTDFSAPPMS